MQGSEGTRGRSASARAAALPREALRPIRWAEIGAVWPWLQSCVVHEVEQRRLFPWLAVAFGAGVLLFFAAEGRPALWAPATGGGVALAAAIALRRHPAAGVVAIGLTALFAGFAAGVIRQDSVHAPALDRLRIAKVSGFIEAVDERDEGARLVLRVHAIAGLTADTAPRRVRVTVRESGALKPGDFIAATARMLPPPEPARPGGYDFARDAYFRGIGAVGSIVGKVEQPAPPHPPDRALRIAAAVDTARNALTRRIADAIGGPAGAVAAALVTGKRGLIEEDTNDALRAAGIYHIVSISGLHMVLAAGTFFWITRAVLALIPFVALHWPVKKMAALVAMAAAAAYCIFSGAEVATERSLVMILVMLGAILVDRPALSLRNLALSALIVLAREPESLLGPSFQMSYGAVAGLTAAAEWARRRWPAAEPAPALPRALTWLVRATMGLLGSTLIASLATAPFGAYHFHTLNPFGLLGNALALPLVSVVVMPCAVLGVVAFPFGLDRPVWEIMGQAVAGVLAASEWVSGLDGASVLVPAFGAAGLLTFAVALLILTIPVSPLRWAAVLPGALALWLAANPQRQDVVVDRSGIGAAVRAEDGKLVLLGRPSAFVIAQWLKADGDARPTDDPTLRTGVRCDRLGCTVPTGAGGVVALVADRHAFEEDCARAAVVLTRLRAPAACAAGTLIDAGFLAAHGATALRWHPSGPVTTVTRRPGQNRPWMRAPDPGGATAAATSTLPRQPRSTPRRPAQDETLEAPGEDALAPSPRLDPNSGAPD